MNKDFDIHVPGATLKAFLSVPPHSKGIILFSHGSGSGRLSPRNQFVANVLQQAGFSTLLIDLLTESEDHDYQNRFDIELLTERLTEIVDCLKKQSKTKHLPIGLFGASTGAAAALRCCVKRPEDIKVVV